MSKENSNPVGRDSATTGEKEAQRSNYLASRILSYANRGLSVITFLGEASIMLMDFTGCDAVELRIVERNKLLRCRTTSDSKHRIRIEVVPSRQTESGVIIPCLDVQSDVEMICEEIINKRFDPALPFFTAKGSFSIGDTQDSVELSSEACKWAGGRTLHIGGDFRSLAIIPFAIGDKDGCLLQLKSRLLNFFTAPKMDHYEELARILGIALAQIHGQVALRERVKELTCLYGIAKVVARPGISLEDILQGTVELLPPGWLYPHLASARIVFDGSSYSTPGFEDCRQKQTTEIAISGERRGTIDVGYREEMPELDEGPFLKEERNLIDAIAREVVLIVESRQMEEDKRQLQEQLRHADRLATLGQLAAGVAHELNEPLASILGFAQLAAKVPEIPEQVRQDNEKIVGAALHAREVINKLKLFARQAPPLKDRANLNDIVRGGLYFLESRCMKAGIELIRVLEPGLPTITADSGQLYQVLVNLVVNSIQAIPDGGRITIRTLQYDTEVGLRVEDTGVGMDEDVLKKIFSPFFTTKDVDKGTGLGLAVVHGIVSSHHGTISVDSVVGQGTSFEVRLPLDAPPEQGEAGSG